MNEVEFIKEQIAKYNLTTQNRQRKYVYKRYYCMYKMYKCGLSLTYIGKLINRNHATVIHGIRMHRRWTRQKDAVYAHEISPIVAAADGCYYEDKYKVKAKETRTDISLLVKIPYEYDLVSNFKDYMTINELVSALQKLN
jgi:hypothetical protein